MPPGLTLQVGRSRTVSHMGDTTTDRKDGFGLLGIGAAACIACCAPLLLAFLGGHGLASSIWIGGLGVVIAVAAAVGFAVARRRRRCDDTCAADGACYG